MPNNTAASPKDRTRILLIVLCTALGLAACNSGGVSTTVPINNTNTPPAPPAGTSTYTLNVSSSGGGTITSTPVGINCGATCSASFASGTSVSLSANASSGYTFSGWSGACTGTGACTTTLSAARSVTAAFAQNPAPVNPSAPSITLSATPTLAAFNATADITWSSTNSSSCSSFPVGINATSGSYTTPPLTATSTYTVTCAGAGGTVSKSVTITVAGGSIANVAAACAAEPMRGTVYYYCDCGTGAQAGCKSGNDANTGTDPLLPQQTIGNAAARFSSLAVNDTVALCKGGAFNSAGNLSIGSTRCGAGVACNDLREYTPTTFAGTAKPLINNAAGPVQLFTFSGNNGGVRLLNLKLKGDGGSGGNQGFFFYRGAHDVTLCNLDMDAFSIAVYNESGTATDATTSNIKLTGSLITNTKAMGYLGGGVNDDISYNYWDGNGSSTPFDHALYFASVKELTNVRVIGNYIRGQYGPTCNGAPIVAHMAVDGLLVKDNVVDIAASATTGGCWGIAFNNFTNAPEAIYHRHAVFSGNTIRNGGNLALTVTGCPGCVIENNLIINELIEARGIVVASGPVRPGIADDVNTRNIIRNNTIWYGPNASNGGTGIEVGTEGTGHVIANNTVTYNAASTGGNGFNCFSYPLALASYAFINNNHCFSVASSNWEPTHGSLAAWMNAASGFDTASITGDPKFNSAGTDFTPATGSPLIGKGNTVYGSVYDMTGKTRPSPPAIGAYEP